MITGIQRTRGNHVESLQNLGEIDVLVGNKARDTEIALQAGEPSWQSDTKLSIRRRHAPGLYFRRWNILRSIVRLGSGENTRGQQEAGKEKIGNEPTYQTRSIQRRWRFAVWTGDFGNQ
jgi:hypothetical protein